HTGRFRILDDAFFRQILDDADALRAERIAQDAQNLPTTGGYALGAAHPALVDAHTRQPAERLLVRRRPRDGAAQPINRRLVVAIDGPHRGAGAIQMLLRRRLFFTCDCSSRMNAHEDWSCSDLMASPSRCPSPESRRYPNSRSSSSARLHACAPRA